MADTALILVGAAFMVGGGIGSLSDDPDIYPRVRILCGLLAVVGAALLGFTAWKVING